MAEIINLNGEAVSSKKCTLILEYDPASGALRVDSQNLTNIDTALNILAQATRWHEAQYRNAQAVAFRQQMEQEEAMMRAAQNRFQ